MYPTPRSDSFSRNLGCYPTLLLSSRPTMSRWAEIAHPHLRSSTRMPPVLIHIRTLFHQHLHSHTHVIPPASSFTYACDSTSIFTVLKKSHFDISVLRRISIQHVPFHTCFLLTNVRTHCPQHMQSTKDLYQAAATGKSTSTSTNDTLSCQTYSYL